MVKGSSTYRTLEEFIQNRMAMSHIYQPAMLIELLRNDGRSALTDIAKALLEHDQSQIEYYEQITKKMVGRVLTDSNAITRKLKDGNPSGNMTQILRGFSICAPLISILIARVSA